VGSKTLDPTFDSSVKSYSVDTDDATNTVSATATDSNDTVEIFLNGVSQGSGTGSVSKSLTWTENTDTVRVEVTHVSVKETYTITVTHEG
jgi:hypothetical protein